MKNPDDGLGSVPHTPLRVFTDFSAHQIRGETHLSSSIPSKTAEAIKMRLSYLKELLPKIVKLATNGTSEDIEIGKIDQQSFQSYQKKWEELFLEIKKYHEEKKWFNPFLSRVVYNGITFLPVGYLTNQISKMINGIVFKHLGIADQFVFHETLVKMKNINKTKMPHGHSFYRLNDILGDVDPLSHRDYFELDLYLQSGSSVKPVLARVKEELKTAMSDLTYVAKHSPTNYSDERDDLAMYVDTAYGIVVTGWLLKQFNHLNDVNDRNFETFVNDRLQANEIIELVNSLPNPNHSTEGKALEPLSLGQIVDKILITTDLIEMLRLGRLLKERHTAQEVFGLEFGLLNKANEVYEKITGFKLISGDTHVLKLFSKSAEVFQEALTDLNEKAMEVAKSNPHVRWIRTAKGEYFIEREVLEDGSHATVLGSQTSTEKTGDTDGGRETEGNRVDQSTTEQNDAGSVVPASTSDQKPECTCNCPVHGDRSNSDDEGVELETTVKYGEVKELVYASIMDIEQYARLRVLGTVGLSDDSRSDLSTLSTSWSTYNKVFNKKASTISPHGDEALPHGRLGETINDRNNDSLSTDQITQGTTSGTGDLEQESTDGTHVGQDDRRTNPAESGSSDSSGSESSSDG